MFPYMKLKLTFVFILNLFFLQSRADAFPESCGECFSGCSPSIDVRPAYFIVTGTTTLSDYDFYYAEGKSKTILLDSVLLKTSGSQRFRIYAENKKTGVQTRAIWFDKHDRNLHFVIESINATADGREQYIKFHTLKLDVKKTKKTQPQKTTGMITLSLTSVISFLIFLVVYNKRKRKAIL